ncbi:MAG: DUF1559 domain-containing protein [Planctomycetaceae bacterium]
MMRTPKKYPAFTRTELCVVLGLVMLLASTALPAIQKARLDSRQVACKNNLKQLGLALHNYHDVYNSFPPGWVSGTPDAKGSQSWGWQCGILPYVDQAALYNTMFEIEHNMELINTPGFQSTELGEILTTSMPPYRCPSDKIQQSNPYRGGWGVSNYSGNFGTKPIARWGTTQSSSNWPGQVPTTQPIGRRQSTSSDGMMWVDSSVGFNEVDDGSSNVILLGERSHYSHAGIWIGPRSNYHESDAVTDGSHASRPNRSQSGFSAEHGDILFVLMCDGSTRPLHPDIESRADGTGLFQRLMSRNDGEPVDEFYSEF